ncbi:MAG: RcnB family protein [Allosphingosinicella sp.]|uniref:RcnB family protein n=1 Tax=Allosphingosinicella sp. TaxID=2823234 RepID=UPI00395FCE1B
MKKLVLAALAAGAAMIPAAASAQVVVSPSGAHVRDGSHDGRFRHGGFRHRDRDRFHVGAFIGASFFAPQFHVRNWRLYGFAPPPPRHRWVRYHDDAYLIDGRGEIYDTRYDVDWDRYGERWDHDRDGIPYYVGDGDYYPDDYDHAYVERERYGYDRYDRYDERYAERDRYERHDRYDDRYDEHYDERYERRDHHGSGWDYSAYGHGRAPSPCAAPCAAYPSSYGHGYGYGGYGYMWIPGTTIITETTVTPVVSTVVTEEVIEEVVETRTHRARPRRAARPCNCAPAPRRPAPAPRHPPGERG